MHRGVYTLQGDLHTIIIYTAINNGCVLNATGQTTQGQEGVRVA